MPVTTLDDQEHLSTEINNEDDIVVDFFAEWCGPCKKGAPLFNDYSNRYPNIKFVAMDIDRMDDEEKNKYQIKTIPLLKRYKNGRLFRTIQGLRDETLTDLLT